MKTTKYVRILSWTLAIISIVWMVYLDHEIAARYNQAEGKTRALFGLIQIAEFGHIIYILFPAGLSIVLATSLLLTNERKPWDMVPLILGLLAIIGVIGSSWKLWID